MTGALGILEIRSWSAAMAALDAAEKAGAIELVRRSAVSWENSEPGRVGLVGPRSALVPSPPYSGERDRVRGETARDVLG